MIEVFWISLYIFFTLKTLKKKYNKKMLSYVYIVYLLVMKVYKELI